MAKNEVAIPTPNLSAAVMNGVSAPKPNTLPDYVWKVADALAQSRVDAKNEHTVPLGKEVRESVLSQLPDAKPINIGNAYRKWLTYNGLHDAEKARRAAERKTPATRMTPEKAIERYKSYSEKVVKATERLTKHMQRMEKAGIAIPSD